MPLRTEAASSAPGGLPAASLGDGAPPRSRGLRRYLAYLLAIGALPLFAVGLIGLAHTEFARPWLGWLGPAVGCPVDLNRADPERVEQFRRQSLAHKLGSADARGRPALDFELGITTRTEVESWARLRSRSCSELRKASVLRCEDLVVAADESTVLDAHFQFDDQARLVAVDLLRAGACAQAATADLQATTLALVERVGPATADYSPADESALETEKFRRVSRKFHYADYVAELSATNFGRRGVRVRETYQWVPRRS